MLHGRKFENNDPGTISMHKEEDASTPSKKSSDQNHTNVMILYTKYYAPIQSKYFPSNVGSKAATYVSREEEVELVMTFINPSHYQSSIIKSRQNNVRETNCTKNTSLPRMKMH
jgi:hypothetical protein